MSETEAAAALQGLSEATDAYLQAERDFAEAGVAVRQAIVAALCAQASVGAVVERSPFVYEYVRRIAREHGVPPARRGRRSVTKEEAPC